MAQLAIEKTATFWSSWVIRKAVARGLIRLWDKVSKDLSILSRMKMEVLMKRAGMMKKIMKTKIVTKMEGSMCPQLWSKLERAQPRRRRQTRRKILRSSNRIKLRELRAAGVEVALFRETVSLCRTM